MNLKELVEKINPDVDKYVNDIFSTVEEAIKNFDWEVISKDSFMWRGIFAYGMKVSKEIEIAKCYKSVNRKYVYITEWAFEKLILDENLGSIPYSDVKDCLPLMVKKGIIPSITKSETGKLFIGIWLERKGDNRTAEVEKIEKEMDKFISETQNDNSSDNSEWHDFENNPDDKPKEEGAYLCYITSVDHDENYAFYGILEFSNGHFVLNRGHSILTSTDNWDDIVIGWFKIKKFERKPRRK